MNLSQHTALLLCLSVATLSNCLAQKKMSSHYELYLAQIAAAEALIQINSISEAHQYLQACDEKFRNVEWHFLMASLDRSERTLGSVNGSALADVKVSPDGRYVAACGSDSVITIYAWPAMERLRLLKGHAAAVTSVDFSSDGSKLVSGGRDHAVIIWDTETGNQLMKNDTSFRQGIYQVKFSHDHSLIGVVSWERQKDRPPYIFGFVKLLDTGSGRELRKIELDNHPATCISFAAGKDLMLIGTWGEVAYAYEISSGNRLWTFDLSDPAEYNAFNCIAVSPDNSMAALGGADHRIYILETGSGKVLHQVEPAAGHSKYIKAVSFSPDGKWLATAGDDQVIMIWNTATWKKTYHLSGHTDAISGLDWTAGHGLFSSSPDGTARYWNLQSSFETTYEICDFGPWQTILTPDGQGFVAPCSDKKLNIVQSSTGAIISDLGMQNGLCAAISKDGSTVFTGSFDGIVRAFDVTAAKEIKTWQGHTARVDGIAYLDRTNQVLSVGDSTLRIWTNTSDSAVKTVRFSNTPFRIAVNADQSFACIAFHDGRVKILDTGTWQEKQSFTCSKGVQEMAISPDDAWLAFFCGKQIELYDTKTGRLKQVFSGHDKPGFGLGFSPDSQYLLSGSHDQTFRCWNLATGACTLTCHAFDDVVYSAQFISQHEILLTGSEGQVWYYRF